MINVLFLCIGNSCRSQMAEAFARTYGSDVMVPFSAGLAPAPIVQPLTKKVMLEKNIDMREDYFPKDVGQLLTENFQTIVNISGRSLPIRASAELIEWNVEDPISQTEEVYIRVRDQLEALVMDLILKLRRSHHRRAPRVAAQRAVRPVPPPPLPPAPAIPLTKPAVEAKPARIGFGRMRNPRD